MHSSLIHSPMHVINIYVFHCNIQKDTSARYGFKTIIKEAS